MTKNDPMDALVHNVEELIRHVAEPEILSRLVKFQSDEINTKNVGRD